MENKPASLKISAIISFVFFWIIFLGGVIGFIGGMVNLKVAIFEEGLNNFFSLIFILTVIIVIYLGFEVLKNIRWAKSIILGLSILFIILFIYYLLFKSVNLNVWASFALIGVIILIVLISVNLEK